MSANLRRPRGAATENLFDLVPVPRWCAPVVRLGRDVRAVMPSEHGGADDVSCDDVLFVATHRVATRQRSGPMCCETIREAGLLSTTVVSAGYPGGRRR